MVVPPAARTAQTSSTPAVWSLSTTLGDGWRWPARDWAETSSLHTTASGTCTTVSLSTTRSSTTVGTTPRRGRGTGTGWPGCQRCRTTRCRGRALNGGCGRHCRSVGMEKPCLLSVCACRVSVCACRGVCVCMQGVCVCMQGVCVCACRGVCVCMQGVCVCMQGVCVCMQGVCVCACRVSVCACRVSVCVHAEVSVCACRVSVCACRVSVCACRVSVCVHAGCLCVCMQRCLCVHAGCLCVHAGCLCVHAGCLCVCMQGCLCVHAEVSVWRGVGRVVVCPVSTALHWVGRRPMVTVTGAPCPHRRSGPGRRGRHGWAASPVSTPCTSAGTYLPQLASTRPHHASSPASSLLLVTGGTFNWGTRAALASLRSNQQTAVLTHRLQRKW